ncbi:YfcC family protein [Romboutsia sp.]|uniref:YfcC family protein n=1 Tax=Romboutsia sp. TaxID=1965302 RepID=UPI003F3D5F16
MDDQKQLPSSKFSFLADLHPFIIVGVVILLVIGLTYIVPGGTFERQEVNVMGMTKEIVIPGSFKPAESVPQGFSQSWTYFMQGAVEAADVVWTIFICSGAITAIIHTGAINSGINSLVKRFGEKSHVLIPILVFTFGLGGASYGMYEDAIPFVLVIAPMMLAMKYDSLVAVMIVQYGVLVGSSAAFLNPFAVGIAQAMADIPMGSGIGVRIVIWFFMMLGTSIYIMRYANKVKKNPELSIVREDDRINILKFNEKTTTDLKTLTRKQKIVLVMVAVSFSIMIYGVITQGWWFNEIGSIFLFMGIIIPLIGGLKINEIIEKNLEGMCAVMSVACLLAASRVITLLLANSNIMDTLLYHISNMFSSLPSVITVWIMFFVVSITMTIVQSSSGLAGTLMPIMAPLADILNIPRQVVVTAFHLGTGTFGFWMPWDGVSFAMCTMAGINFFKYIKKTAHFVFTFYIPACLVVLTIVTLMGFK